MLRKKIMTNAKQAIGVDAVKNLEQLIQNAQKNLEIDKKLFKPEIRISIAYCDSLFEAGILNRLDSDKIKNGLLTILKRSEYDRTYFDKSNSKNIHSFIEEKLFHLVGEIGLKIQVGRSLHDRNSTALRLWLRNEIVQFSKLLHRIQSFFAEFAENNRELVFLFEIAENNKQPILFAHWCLAYFEIFKRDRERLDEVWRRVNVLSLGANNGIGTSFEFDREALAQRLGFQGITTNSFDSIINQDYLLEFVNGSNLLQMHLSQLVENIIKNIKSNNFSFATEIEEKNLQLIKGKLRKIFVYQTEINLNLQSKSLMLIDDFNGNREAIFAIVDLLNLCFKAILILLENITINTNKIKIEVEKIVPSKNEIFDYLVQRNEPINKALRNAKTLEDIFKNNKQWRNINLNELQRISPVIENDFYDELSLETIINSKNQIGGTSFERVSEALTEAKSALQYEE